MIAVLVLLGCIAAPGALLGAIEMYIIIIIIIITPSQVRVLGMLDYLNIISYF